jgi:hypothetical protein
MKENPLNAEISEPVKSFPEARFLGEGQQAGYFQTG